MNHQIVLAGIKVGYTLRRGLRRTLALNITPQGLEVRAPIQISDDEIKRLLQRKTNWILSKLEAVKQNPPFAWRNGEVLWLLGNALRLQLASPSSSPLSERTGIRCEDGMLFFPHTAVPEWLEGMARLSLVSWYQKQALADFTKRVALFAPRLGLLEAPPVRVSNAQTLWGSCNSKGEVRLNWRLIQGPPVLINYVVCHELAHLKEMNHSAAFWQVVASLYPDYQEAERVLKEWAPRLKRL